MSTRALAPILALDTDERCDRCNAAAKLRIRLASGGELTFCGHDANRLASELAEVAVAAATAEGFDWRGAVLMDERPVYTAVPDGMYVARHRSAGRREGRVLPRFTEPDLPPHVL